MQVYPYSQGFQKQKPWSFAITMLTARDVYALELEAWLCVLMVYARAK
jgi:hypothetical protein